MKYSQTSKPGKALILRHPALVLLLANLLILIFAELALRVFASLGYISIIVYPTSDPSQRLLGDINKHFGIWRYPNRSAQVTAPCFDVENKSNSFGARDKERALRSKAETRLIVLGDSFAEGFGVAQEKRFSDVFERETGIEVLNFGISGNFGTVQEWLLYEHLAMQFDHSHVLVFFLPSNDFDDNDPKSFPSDRYRPYLQQDTEGTFSVYYSVDFEKRKQNESMGASQVFRRKLYNRIYLLNVIRQFGDFWESSEFKDSIDELEAQTSRSRYVEYRKKDIQRTLFSFENIIRLAGQRRVSFLVIPRAVDFAAYENSGRKTLPLTQELLDFANAHEHALVIDLLPHFLAHAQQAGHAQEDYFLQCDGHWSELGHRALADILRKELGL